MIEALKRNAWSSEGNMRCIREREQLTGKQSWIVCLMDLEGLQIGASLISFCANQYRAFCCFILGNYVEVVKKFVMVNAPSPIYYIWNYLIGPFVPHKTREKLIILGSDWRDMITKHIDPCSLPKYWGGSLVDADGDEMCRYTSRADQSAFEAVSNKIFLRDIPSSRNIEICYTC